MPRTSSGVYNLPASDVNPPIAGAVIDPVAFAAATTDIATEITNSLDRLGRGAMQAALSMGTYKITNIGAPVASTDAARLGDLSAGMTGMVALFAMNTVPLGWLECNGAAVSRTTYAALFATIGTVWGAGNGTTTFNVPDVRGDFLRAWDHGRGHDPGRTFASVQTSASNPWTGGGQPSNVALLACIRT